MTRTNRHHLRTALGAGLAGALLLAGCATRTAGTASVGTAGPVAASVSSPSAPAAPETNAADTEQPPSSAAVPATASEPPGNTAGDSSSVESTIAEPSAPVTDAAVDEVCHGFSQMLASFVFRPADPAKGYQWWWTLRAGEPGVLRLWSPDNTEWVFEVPVDQSRDQRLCQDLLDLDTVDEPAEGSLKRAYLSFTTKDSRTSKFVVAQEHAVGFEDLVLDRLPADVFTEMNNTLIQWQEQNPGTPAKEQTSVATTGKATAPDTASPGPSASTSVPKELEDYANQCEQLVLATVTFSPSGDLAMSVTLTFDTEQGSVTAQLGDASTSVDFALREDADPVLMCRMLINDSEQRGHDGKDEFGAIGTVHIETSQPDLAVFSGPFAFPSVNISTVLAGLMPEAAMQELKRFAEENAG